MLLVVDYRTWRLALGYRIEGLGMKEGSGIQGLGYRVRVEGLGLRAWGPKVDTIMFRVFG